MVNVPTMKVRFGDSFMIINEADFDPSKHEKFEESAKGKDGGKAKDSKPDPAKSDDAKTDPKKAGEESAKGKDAK